MAPKLEMQQVGDGNDLVLLHSLLADARAFQPLLPALESGFRVTVPSLPGYGGSPPSQLGILEVARDVMAALESSGVHRFHLLGNGYGGFVALAMSQQFGDRIDRLVLLDTAAYFPPSGKEGVAAMKKAVEAGGMPAVVETALARLFPDSFRSANPALVETYRKSLLDFDPDAFASTCQNLIDVDLRKGLAGLHPPTLVVVGEEDAATPPALSRELVAHIPGARLVELPGCGHAPHIQAPDIVLKILEDFLASEHRAIRATTR